jgi:hypothetical protein
MMRQSSSCPAFSTITGRRAKSALRNPAAGRKQLRGCSSSVCNSASYRPSRRLLAASRSTAPRCRNSGKRGWHRPASSKATVGDAGLFTNTPDADDERSEWTPEELGSLSKVIDDDIERRLGQGIRHRDVERLAREIERADLDAEKKRVSAEELEATRERQEDLKAQIERCRSLLQASRKWVGFEAAPFRAALSSALELLGAPPLAEATDDDGRPVWTFPPLDRRAESDVSWAATLDTLRAPRKQNQKLTDWRREAPIRRVVFEDAGVLTEETVHLHLEQRVAQRLLARFRTHGFVHHDLSRACLAQATDSIPRTILLGRLSLYGQGAERLHEELVPITARWIEPSQRKGPLLPYARDAEARTLELLERSLGGRAVDMPGEAIQRKLLDAAPRDIEELLLQLEPRAEELAALAIEKLKQRGEREAKDLRETLERQRERVREELAKHEDTFRQLTLDFGEEEKRQLESDMRSWRMRLEQFDHELEREPQRIRAFYEVRARRVEPYLPDFRAFALAVLDWSFSPKTFAGTTECPIPAELEVALLDYGETLRPDFAVRELEPKDDASAWQLVVRVLDLGEDFDRVVHGAGQLEASAHSRMERLLRQSGVPAGLLFNGRTVRLVSAPRGESSGWIDFHVADMVQTAGRPISTALRLLLGQARLLSLPRPQRFAALLEDSRKFQNEVSERLAEQVLHALYELLRGFQAAHDASKGELLREPLAEQPDDIYRALLTVILRLVFLLFAEERDMRPEHETFVRYYSVACLYERLRGCRGVPGHYGSAVRRLGAAPRPLPYDP